MPISPTCSAVPAAGTDDRGPKTKWMVVVRGYDRLAVTPGHTPTWQRTPEHVLRLQKRLSVPPRSAIGWFAPDDTMRRGASPTQPRT
jgi:hypothetical protein